MSKLITLSEDSNFLDKIFSNDVLIYEDVQASKIWINWDGDKFTFRPKSVTSEPLNLVDLAIQNYYNPAINFFNNLDKRVKGLMPKKWYFCFEFFPDEQPANIVYNRVPKNNLVLTSIWKGGKYDYDIDEISEFSRLFDVECLPVIFQGRLSDSMKEGIKYFLSTSESDLEYVFGEKSFSFFFYKILNPQSENSFLMDDFQTNLQKIVIRIEGDENSFEILNPLYQRISNQNSTEFTDVYTLLLVNFLTFCQSINLSEIKIKGEKKDECYIYLISNLYNMYISDVKQDLMNFEFTIPEFFNKEKFKINKELIKNKLTKEIIDESEKLEYIFKVILGSMNKKKNKPIGVFTESTVDMFNRFVDHIDSIIDNHLGKIREIQISKSGLVDFGQFLDIKYDVDGSGDVYPINFSDEFQKISSEKDKTKKKNIEK